MFQVSTFNPFPKGKILDLSKFKAFADNKIDLSKKLIFVLARIENIVGNGENAGNWHFLLFPNVFKSLFYQSFKSLRLFGKGLKELASTLNSL